LPAESVDCMVSNCVINLAPDKAAVFREMHRVLKPGGRVAVSDIALKKALPEELVQNVLAYVGCIAGAVSIADYERALREAGFAAVQVIDSGKDLNAYAKMAEQAGCCAPVVPLATTPADGCCSPSSMIYDGLVALLRKYDINAYAASVQVYAIKAP